MAYFTIQLLEYPIFPLLAFSMTVVSKDLPEKNTPIPNKTKKHKEMERLAVIMCCQCARWQEAKSLMLWKSQSPQWSWWDKPPHQPTQSRHGKAEIGFEVHIVKMCWQKMTRGIFKDQEVIGLVDHFNGLFLRCVNRWWPMSDTNVRNLPTCAVFH